PSRDRRHYGPDPIADAIAPARLSLSAYARLLPFPIAIWLSFPKTFHANRRSAARSLWAEPSNVRLLLFAAPGVRFLAALFRAQAGRSPAAASQFQFAGETRPRQLDRLLCQAGSDR